MSSRNVCRPAAAALPMFNLLQRGITTASFGSRFTFAARCASSMASEAFKKHEVVPDVLSVAPEKTVKVVFDSGAEANLGNVLTPTQVQNQPKEVTWEADSNSLYTLIKTDPDAPSRKEPKFREWHHWIVANIPGNEIAKGDVLSQYIGAGPPENTGLHRYVYLVYKQPGQIQDKEHGKLGFSGEKRNNWSVDKFAKKHNLGNPVAGNIYQAEYDDYVPKLYARLS